MASDLELAWAAGFFDGEGCVAIQRKTGRSGTRGGYYMLHASVAQKDPKYLRDFLNIVQCGNVYLNRKPTSATTAEMWNWRASSAIALKALELLVPYLRVKREQAEVGIAYQKRRRRLRQSPHSAARIARHFAMDTADWARMKALKRAVTPIGDVGFRIDDVRTPSALPLELQPINGQPSLPILGET